MGNCENCSSKDSCTSNGNCGGIQIEYNPKNNIKHVIAVMSGKGGVGKSTVAVLLAKELANRGHSVGVLDADITGPSIPRLMGTVGEETTMQNEEIIPVTSPDGIKTISLNYFMPEETQPVVWRGPMIAGAVKQFWTDVIWGDIDFLVVDLPPGTGDVTLTVMQSMPVDGVVAVSLPQSMVSMIVMKAINMMTLMHKNIIGVVENMCYIECSECGKKHMLFEGEDGYSLLIENNQKIIAKYPMAEDVLSAYSNGDKTIKEQTTLLADAVINSVEK